MQLATLSIWDSSPLLSRLLTPSRFSPYLPITAKLSPAWNTEAYSAWKLPLSALNEFPTWCMDRTLAIIIIIITVIIIIT
jgi:hypothetical protein